MREVAVFRKRTSAPVRDLVQTLSQAPLPPEGYPDVLPPIAHSGHLSITSGGDTAVLTRGEFVRNWVELRGTLMCLYDEKGSTLTPKTVLRTSFCTKVNPPHPSWRSNFVVVEKAEALMSVSTLAVYTATGACWCQCSDSIAREAWAKAIKDQLEMVEDTRVSSAKQSAYDRLEPLCWRQLLSQADFFLSLFAGLGSVSGFNTTFQGDCVRADEKHSGWIEVRQALQSVNAAHATDLVPEVGEWETRFGGLIDGALVWYTDDNACVPLDIVALEHATIGTVDGCAPPMTDEGPRSNRARAPDARPPR